MGGAQDTLLDHAEDFGGGAVVRIAEDAGLAVEELDLQEADGFAVVAGFADLALGFLHYLGEDDPSFVLWRGGRS